MTIAKRQESKSLARNPSGALCAQRLRDDALFHRLGLRGSLVDHDNRAWIVDQYDPIFLSESFAGLSTVKKNPRAKKRFGCFF